MGAGGSPPSPPSPRVPGRPAHPASRRAPPRPAHKPRPTLPSSANLPPRRAPYLAIAAALRAHWPRAGCVGAGPGPAGAGKEGGGGPARGEGGADPDVHSWAPGEVEAPGPAAGGRATDAGTGTAAAATMVKARRHSLPGPGAPPELKSPPPSPHSPWPEQGGSPGWGRGGVPDPGGHHRCRLRRGLPARAPGLGSDPASLSQPPPLAQAGVPLSASRSGGSPP